MKKNFRRRAGNADCKIETSIRKIQNRRRQEKFPLISNNSQVPLIINKCLSDESLFLSISNDSLTSECSKLPLKPANSKQVVEITGIDSRFPKKKTKNSEFSTKIKNSNCGLKNNFQKSKSSPDIFLDGVVGDLLDAADEKGDEIPLIGYLKEELPKNHQKIEKNEEKIQLNYNWKEKFPGNCGKIEENEGLAKITKKIRKNDGKIPLICDLGEELPENLGKVEKNEEEIPLICNSKEKLSRSRKKNGENEVLSKNSKEIKENEGKIPLICNLKEKVSKNRRKIGENEKLSKKSKEIKENGEKIPLIYHSEEELPENYKKIDENEGKIPLIYNLEKKLCENHKKIEENEGKIQLIYNSKEKVSKNRKKIEENEEKILENCEKIEENEGKISLIYNSDEKIPKNHKKIEENGGKIQLNYNSEEKIPKNPEKIEENEDFEKKNEPEEAQDDEEIKGKRKLEEFCLRHLQRSKALEPIDDFQPKKNHLLLKKVTIDELQQKFNDIRARLDQQPCDYVIKEDLPKKFSGCPCKMKSGRPRKVSFHVPPENQVDFSKKKMLSRALGPPKRRIDECEREYFCKEIVSVRKNLRTVRNRLLSRASSVEANCEELIMKRDEDWEIDGAIYDDARGIMFPKETRKLEKKFAELSVANIQMSWRCLNKKAAVATSRKLNDNNCLAGTRTTGPKSILRLRAGGRGETMQSNGTEGVSENGVDRTGWTVGLINGKFKYLTAETFGFKINANGSSLKKKQLWTLEGSEHQVYLRSHLDRYLAVDQFGNVTCEAEDPSDPGCAFQITLASDGSGRWALKNIQRGYFLGSSQDELKCTAKAPGEAEYWLVHLAARPQVNLRSAGRKRFAHLSATQDEIHVDAPVPWGEDTLFTLEFRPAANPDNDPVGHGKSEGGHYALHTCNNKYLARDGKLLDTCTRDCLYAAEFHAGLLSLRDIHGAYLAPIGSKAVLKSRSTTVTRDELFSLEESLPQASFVAALNQRYVSVKQGVDVTANQDEISGHETFQLEFDRVTKRWYVRTMQDRYWTLEAGGGIQASDHKRSSNALFDLIWQPEDGTVALRANNGKFLGTKRSGHLYANTDSPTSGDSDASKYYFYLMNRPILVLRCEQGFVGAKSAASPKLECNKAGYETIRVERCERGIVRFKGQNGKYWNADSEGVTVDADQPSVGFYLELREPSRICIKCTDGRYLSAGKNGALRLGETDYESATKWEF